VKGIGKTLGTVWRIAVPYFRSEDRWAGRILLAAVIGIELAIVAINVLINRWNARFYDALQNHAWDSFVSELIYFSVLAALFIILAVYQLYLNQWLQIRWRAWMTRHYLGEWLHDANHYRMQLTGNETDNPDQRVTEDVRMFVDQTLSLGVGLLSSVVTLASFVVILWGLSATAPLHLFGADINIPGYLVWGALIYAIFGTLLTHLIGRPLIGLNFEQQKREATFRFSLVRVRENSEQIAILRGERAERSQLLQKFGSVVDNWISIMVRTKKLTAFTASYSQASVVFPFILVAPAYFAGKVQLGGMMQTASAFSSVQGALSFFVTIYRSLAEWRSVVIRLDGFETALQRAQTLHDSTHGATAANKAIALRPGKKGGPIDLDELLVHLPNGKPLAAADSIRLRMGERTLIKGPSGAGKSTLFRAIAGIWPFGHGTVTIPAGAELMLLPQRPYFPIGSLREAVAYPSDPSAFTTEEMKQVIAAVGLPALAADLDGHRHWNATLSLGEQQRLAIARAILHEPQYLFLDEATASLDEPSEAALYRLLDERLPHAAIISIGHRSTLAAFHEIEFELAKDGDRFALTEQSAKG